MQIMQSHVIETSEGFEQQIVYPHAGRTRTEIYAGRTELEPTQAVAERVTELKAASHEVYAGQVTE